jgi:hypothetical protein
MIKRSQRGRVLRDGPKQRFSGTLFALYEDWHNELTKDSDIQKLQRETNDGP